MSDSVVVVPLIVIVLVITGLFLVPIVILLFV